MLNLQLIEDQPHWRIWVVAWFARIMGVCIHVEGIPFGSSRLRKKRAEDEDALGEAASGQIGGRAAIETKGALGTQGQVARS